MNTTKTITAFFTALIFVSVSTGCSVAPPTIQNGDDAEISFDGLHKVDNSMADSAWARPDFDISGYSKIMLVGAGIEYTPADNRGRTTAERNRGGPYFIDDRTRERFETLVQDSFREEISKIEHFT